MGYETFYRLKYEPFAVKPDPRFYFNSPQHAIAREYLLHAAVKGRGLALLMGAIGTGKTTLARRLFNEFTQSEEYNIGMMVLTHSITPLEFLKRIATVLELEIEEENPSALFSTIVNKLFEIHSNNQKTVIFIDEANKLGNPDTLEEIRGFVNLETADGSKLLTFILIGLPDLEMQIAKNPALHQRVAVRVYLNPMPPDAVIAYIRHRLRIAGREDDLFTEKAMELIAKYSGGTPRLVNIICDNALIEGYIQRKPLIDEFIIERVAKNLNLIPQEI